MTDSHDFPVDIAPVPGDEAGALRWTTVTLALCTLALALLNAGAISGWTQDLPPSPRTAKLMAAADAWHDLTAAAGLDQPHAKLHHVWTRAEAAPWPGSISRGRCDDQVEAATCKQS